MDLQHGGAFTIRCSEILGFYPAFPAAEAPGHFGARDEQFAGVFV
jgi:hypothetical protein